MWIIDRENGRFLAVNDMAMRVYGYSREEFLSLEMHDLLVEEEAEAIGRSDGSEAHPRYLAWPGVRRHKKKNGSLVEVEIESIPSVFDGRPAELVTARDITARRFIESALIRSEERFSRIFASSPVPASIWSLRDARLLEGNDRLFAMLGVPREALLGRLASEVFTWLDPDRGDAFIGMIRDPTPRETVETRFLTRAGATYDVFLRTERIDYGGEPAALVFIHDITKRKRVEQALKESEERYRNLVEISPDTVLIHREGRIVFVNPAGARLFGAGYPERMIGMPVLDIVHPDHKEAVEQRIRTIKTFGLSTPLMEQKWVRLDGSIVEVEATATRFIDAAKPAIQVIARDITKRRTAQRAARDSHERFLLVSRATNDLVWDWDLITNSLWWNDGARTVLGYATEEVDPTIKWWYDRIHPDDKERVVASIHDTIQGGERFWSAEYRYRRADGTYAHFYDRGYVLREESGRPIRMIGAMLDVTDRKLNEQKLRFQAGVLAQVRDAVIAVDNDERRVIHWNPGAERLYGFTADETLGRRLADIVGCHWPMPEDRQAALDILRLKGEWHGELVHHRKNLEEILVEVSVSSLRNDEGTTVGFLVVLRDISERNRAERERARLFEEVREGRERLGILSLRLVALQEAERREIARELHDEIGQQLTGLQLILEMQEQRRSHVDAAPEAKRIVEELMERVRELSMNLRPPMLDDLGLVPALLWHFERYTLQTGIQVEFHHAGIQRLTQEVETGAFRIVQEALTNVARHGKARQVKVTLRSGPDRLQILVDDDGAGFDAERVLQSAPGGIAGMRERARLLGGSLRIESSPGAGTQLRAELSLGASRGETVPDGDVSSHDREPRDAAAPNSPPQVQDMDPKSPPCRGKPSS